MILDGAGARRALAALALAAGAGAAAPDPVQAPRQAEVLLSDSLQPPAAAAGWQRVTLPDDSAASRPAQSQAMTWYRIAFEGPAPEAAAVPWAVYLPYLYDGGAVWLDGVQVGSVPESRAELRARTYRPQLLGLPPPLLRPGRNLLEVRVAPSPSYATRFGQPAIGPREALQPLYDRRVFWTRTVPQITVVVSLMVAAFVLFIWWRRRSEVLYGLFGLAAALWGTRTLTFVFETMTQAQWRWWRPLYQGATGGFVVVMALFTLRFAGLRQRALERVLIGYGLAGPLLLALAGPRHEPVVARAWLGGMIPVALLIMAVVLRFVWRQRSAGAWVLAGAMVFAVAVGAHDYFLTWNSVALARLLPEWTGHRIHLLHLGSNTLLLAMGALLTARFIQALGGLEELNRTLEARVADREQALATNYRQLAALQRAHAAAEERQLIMRDLHDGLGSQLFTSLSRVERGDMDDAQVAGALRGCIAEMRLALDALATEERDVGTAFGNFMFRWQALLAAAGVRPAWSIELPEDAAPALAPHALLHLLRVAQEALTNVLKHAAASQVHVRLWLQGGALHLQVRDNGTGLPPPSGAPHPSGSAPRGRGLSNMQARARQLGGRLQLNSDAGGTCVELALPLDAAA